VLLLSNIVYNEPTLVLLRNNVGGGPTKIPGSDKGRLQGHIMAQSGILLALETKVAESLLENRGGPWSRILTK